MPNITKTLSLDKANYFLTHLSLVNQILPVKMTPKETELLAAFMSVDGEAAKYRFTSMTKKDIMKALNLSASGLSNHMKELVRKKFIKEDEQGNLHIWPLLIPASDEQIYNFRLINTG